MSLDPEFAKRVAEAALDKAFRFFLPCGEMAFLGLEQMDLAETDNKAESWLQPAYLRWCIKYDPARHGSGEELWESIGHEVAHVLLCDFDQISLEMPKLGPRLGYATERAVVRLERLFMRECPYPGDAQFEAP